MLLNAIGKLGALKGAWDEYRQEGTAEIVRDLVGELNLDYLIWTVNEHTRREQFDEGDMLSRASFLGWIRLISQSQLKNVPMCC